MNPQNTEPWWRAFATPQFAISTLFIAITTYVIVKVLEGDYGNEVKLVIITVVVSNGLPDLRKFWLNSTNESEKKNETINTLAKGTGGGGVPQKEPLKVDVVGTPDNPPDTP